MRPSKLDAIGRREWLPELLLVISVVAMSPMSVNFVTTSVEHGSGELEASAVVALIVIPSLLFLHQTLRESARAGACPLILKRVGCDRLFRIHLVALVALLVTQAVFVAISFQVVGALEVTHLLLRFFLLVVPFNSIAVLGWTSVASSAVPGRWHKVVRVSLSALLVVFSLVAVFLVSSTIVT